MPDDRTTRAKRALELASEATEGPWRYNSKALGTEASPGLFTEADVSSSGAPSAVFTCTAFWSHSDGDFCAESRTLLPDLAQDVLDLEADCEVLRQLRDYDYCNALDGFAGLHEDIDWLESVISAGREMYELACSEVAYQRDIIAAFQEHNNGAQPPLKTIELAEECDQLRAENERLRAELEAERELSLKRRDYLQRINRAIWPTTSGLGDALRLQDHMHDVVRDMRAEIERLREALWPFAGGCITGYSTPGAVANPDCCVHCRARAALSAAERTDEANAAAKRNRATVAR